MRPRTWPSPLWALALTLTLAACASKSLPPTEIPENRPNFEQDLAKGKIFTSAYPVEGRAARLGKVIGMVDAPPEEVWKIVTHYEDYTQFMPLVVESTVEPLGGTKCRVRQTYKVKFYEGDILAKLIPVSYWLELQMSHTPRIYHIDWVMLQGEIKDTYGSWDLAPFGPEGQQTKVTYQLYFELGNAVLDSSARLVDESILPLVITSIRDRAATIDLDALDVPAYALPPEVPTLEQDIEKAFEGLDLGE